MKKNFRKRDNTASLTEELLNINSNEDEEEKNEAIEQAERNSLMDDLKIMNELNSMCLDFEEEKKDYESFKKAYENNKKAISNHERNVFFHEKVLKNKRLQLLINEDVLTDLKTEARSHDISVNELVNRLIQSFLYEGGE